MQLPFDGHFRRRLYLVRHGQAGPTKAEHGAYGDAIPLTDQGRREAEAMRDALADVPFDCAYSSDIHRTQETAAIILGQRNLPVEPSVRFTEMRGDIDSALKAAEPQDEKLRKFAYGMWQDGPDVRFFGGDHVGEYLARTAATLTDLVATTPASTLLIVSHSGFQRAALCWALNAAPLGIAMFEQDSCCLNILDIDVTAAGEVVRKHVRLANYSPLDPVKLDNRLTDGERLAVRLSETFARLQAG